MKELPWLELPKINMKPTKKCDNGNEHVWEAALGIGPGNKWESCQRCFQLRPMAVPELEGGEKQFFRSK
eukprot:g24876.t1